MDLHELSEQMPQISPNIGKTVKITLKDGVNVVLLFDGANGKYNLKYIWKLAKQYGMRGEWDAEEDIDCAIKAENYLNLNICDGCSVQISDDVWIVRVGYDIEPFTVHATFCTSNFGGIEVELSPCGDGVRYRHNYGEAIPDAPKEAVIEYRYNPELDETENEEIGPFACFVDGEGENERVYFLSDFLRVKK